MKKKHRQVKLSVIRARLLMERIHRKRLEHLEFLHRLWKFADYQAKYGTEDLPF